MGDSCVSAVEVRGIGDAIPEMCGRGGGDRPRAGDPVPPPRFYRRVPLVATSVSMPRALYKAIGEVCKNTGETRSSVLNRYCIPAVLAELRARRSAGADEDQKKKEEAAAQ